MNELAHLKSMWSAKTKRNTVLIVPQITYKDGDGSLNNESWEFKVWFAFRDALDIKFEERKKNKKPYMIWTQGPILSFKEGDTIHSREEKRIVQVRYANQMSWDDTKVEMNQGSVFYSEYTTSNNAIIEIGDQTCTQMQFLQLLIYGEYVS
jgi:hypothetical protein